MRIIGNNPAADNAEITAVASGTLPSGQPVVVNADGTVSVVGTSTNALGTQATVDSSANGSPSDAAYDTANQKLLVCYKDGGNSNYGTAVVGTISGTSISFGTAVVFSSGTTDDLCAIYDDAAGKIVISYKDTSNSSQGKSIVGTISNTSISFGTAVNFGSYTDSIGYVNMSYDSNSNRVFVGFRQSGSGNRYSCVIGTVSGTGISFGSVTVIDSNTTSNNISTFDSTNNKIVVSWRDHNNSFYGETAVGTISNTSISFGSTVVAFSLHGINTGIGFDSTSGKVVLATNNSTNNLGNAYVGTVSGTSISWGSAVQFASSLSQFIEVNDDVASGKTIISYKKDSANPAVGTLNVGTVSGTTISLEAAVSFTSQSLGSNTYGAAYDSTNNQLVYVYGQNSQTNNARTYSATSTNLTAENFIGFSGGAVEVSGSANQVIGSETNFETGGRVEHLSAAYDANAQKVVIAYRDNTNSNYGTAIVGTVSGTSITFGTAVVYHADATNYSSIVYDENAQKVVIAYQDDNDSNKGTAIVGTVSGTGISFGSPTVFDTDNAYINTVYDANAQKIVISYNDGGNSDYGTAVVGTVSGASISFGTPVVFTTTDTRINDIVYDSTAQKVVVAYRNFDASDAGTAVVGTVSGTSISFGTPVVFDSGGTDRLSATYDTVADAVVIFYGDKANSYYGTAIVGNVSGTSIAFGTKQVFESAEIREIGATYDSVAQRAVLGYRDVGNTERGTIIAAQVDGTTMTFGTTEVFAQDPRHINATYDSDQERVVFAYDDENASRGRSCVVEVGYENITRAEVASGSNAVIDIGSAISTNQLSLTAGQQYFVQTDGTLGLTAGNPSVIAGTAISATEIIVKG